MAGRQHAGLGSWSHSRDAVSCAARRCSLWGVLTALMGPGVFVPRSNGSGSGSGQMDSQGRSIAKRNSCKSEEPALRGPYPRTRRTTLLGPCCCTRARCRQALPAQEMEITSH